MKSNGLICLFCALVVSACAGVRPERPVADEGQVGRCQPITPAGVAALFDRWNRSLATGDAAQVVALYADRSILLPTLWNGPATTREAKLKYFEYFLKDRPSGRIDQRFVDIACDVVVDAGLYTFTFAGSDAVAHARYSYTWRWNGTDWRITSHHSSKLPQPPGP